MNTAAATIKISILLLVLFNFSPAQAQVLCGGATCPPTLAIAPGGTSTQVSVNEGNGTTGCNTFTATNVFAPQNLWVFVPTGSHEEMDTFMWAITNPVATAPPNPNASNDPNHPERMCCGLDNRVNYTKPHVPSTYVYSTPADGHPSNAILKDLPRAPSSWLVVANGSSCGPSLPNDIRSDIQVQIPSMNLSAVTVQAAPPPVVTPAAPTVAPGNLVTIVPPPDTSSYATNGGGDGDGGDGGDGSDGSGDGGDGG